jgi:hypothetical protein
MSSSEESQHLGQEPLPSFIRKHNLTVPWLAALGIFKQKVIRLDSHNNFLLRDVASSSVAEMADSHVKMAVDIVANESKGGEEKAEQVCDGVEAFILHFGVTEKQIYIKLSKVARFRKTNTDKIFYVEYSSKRSDLICCVS